MKRSNTLIQMLLLPLSWLYGMAMHVRNWLYNTKIFRSESFNVPIICIGNITAGGTGKTPHVEYVARILQEKYTVALLSRGYKRKTRGFMIADPNVTADLIGDEPLQMMQNLGTDIIVAVDTKRRRGIKNLLKLRSDIDVILLDDAFQHRSVEAGLNVLLMDFNQPIYRDRLLPAGNLRESVSGKKRADIIVVSKCPNNIKPIDIRVITKDLKPLSYQTIFFSTYRYVSLYHIVKNKKHLNISELKYYNVLLVTGIAQPETLKTYLELLTANLHTIHYADHHRFSLHDIKQIEKTFSEINQPTSIIITTEKDAARLKNHLADFTKDCLSKIYILPIAVDILQEKEMEFRKKIMDFCKENKRNPTIFH